MVLPSGFAQLSLPEQLFVGVNLERVDRGLPPFGGLTIALNGNAQRGADDANDPPDPGPAYLLSDAEWAGGSVNGLDAVYGWMYDDGFDSGNLDCLHRGAPGCWGHRKGILDNFGSGANLAMGAAVAKTGRHPSWRRGWDLHGDHAGRRERTGAVLHLQLGPGPGCPAPGSRLTVQAKIFVNPSCSKCRSALALLDEHHMEAEVVRYLDDPPTRADLVRRHDTVGHRRPSPDDAHRGTRLCGAGARRSPPATSCSRR